MAFRTLNDKETGTAKYGLQEDGSYNIYMLTNNSYNKDVVRVASNNAYSSYVFKTDRDGNSYTGNYQGNEYRSVIFDVAHYRPFRFAAQVRVDDENGDGSKAVTTPGASALLSNESHGDQAENEDEVSLSYKPGQKVDILLDITSFKGSDNRSVHPFGEVFGEEFNVYIDAPMLEVDYARMPDNWKADKNSQLKADKLRPDPSVPGRFIYTVSKTRAQEKEFGYEKAHHVDAATSRYDDFGGVVPNVTIDQSGERKCLPFKKTSITSKGDINITSEKEKVVFWDKTFEVKTEHMRGILQYKDAKEGILPVPDDAFIAFVRLRTNARIGVVTLNPSTGGPGAFELNLRDEYTFGWNDDPIDFYYTAPDGTVYNLNLTTANGEKDPVDLNQLYEILTSGKPIVLTTVE
jgi:hypothetical protein